MSQQDKARKTGRAAKKYNESGIWIGCRRWWHDRRAQRAWTRSLGILMTLMLVMTVVPIVPATDASRAPDDQPAGCEGDPQELGVHPTEELHRSWAQAMELKYDALRLVYSAQELDDLDELLAQDDALIDPLGTIPAAPWEDDPDQDLQAGSDLLVGAEELSRSDDSVEILKDYIEIAAGSPPTLHTRVFMVEKSGHMDLWSFFVSVQAFSAGCSMGTTSDDHPIEDKYGKRDRWVGLLELPLAEISEDLSGITDVEVSLDAKVCRYGWFSGKKKSCENPVETGEIEVEVMDQHD